MWGWSDGARKRQQQALNLLRFCFHRTIFLTRPHVLLGKINTWESLAFSFKILLDDIRGSKALPISPASSPHLAPFIPTNPNYLEFPEPRSLESPSSSYSFPSSLTTVSPAFLPPQHQPTELIHLLSTYFLCIIKPYYNNYNSIRHMYSCLSPLLDYDLTENRDHILFYSPLSPEHSCSINVGLNE